MCFQTRRAILLVLDWYSHVDEHFVPIMLTCETTWSHMQQLQRHVNFIPDITHDCVWLIDVHTWLSFSLPMITCQTTWSVASPAQTHMFSDSTCNCSHVRDRFLHVVVSFVPRVLMWNYQGVGHFLHPFTQEFSAPHDCRWIDWFTSVSAR